MSIEPLTTISADEIALLNAACLAFDVDEISGDALNLCVNTHDHEWIVDSRLGQLHLRFPNEPGSSTPHHWVPVSERIRRFANIVEADELQLMIADDSTIVATSGAMSAAVDLVPQHRQTPEALPLTPTASATLSLRELTLSLIAARCLPAGVVEPRLPMPPLWMQFADESFGFHVDWTEFEAGRATYRVLLPPGVVTGTATVSIPHLVVERFLRAIPPVDPMTEDERDVTVLVGVAPKGHGHADVVAFQTETWQLLLWLTHPSEERWSEQIEQIIGSTPDIQITDTTDIDWILDHRATQVVASVHGNVVRVSAVVASAVEETLDLLRELSQLNASSNGVRYWWDDGLVRSVADLRCTDLPSLPFVVRDVARSARDLGPVISSLGASVA